MRRVALLVGMICLAMSLFSAKEAQASWFGLNVAGGGCTSSGTLAASCPSVAAACESFAIFRNSSRPVVVSVVPVSDSQGRLEGYTCNVVFFAASSSSATSPSRRATPPRSRTRWR